MQQSDLSDVLKMMSDLWPEDFDGELSENETVFVSEMGGKITGFVAFAVRPWVEGADIAPCPHIEGWYVSPEYRRQGIGGELVRAVEVWAKQKGFSELTSDVEMKNTISLDAHKALEFEPTSQVQYFKKKL